MIIGLMSLTSGSLVALSISLGCVQTSVTQKTNLYGNKELQ